MLVMKIKFLLCLVCFGSANSFSQNRKTPNIDVMDYSVFLTVNDTTDVIRVEESIQFRWLDTSRTAEFDLAGINSENKGMVIDAVYHESDPISFTHKNDILIIDMNGKREVNECKVKLIYSGIPIDGLVISKNKYGNRTFFADNWPDRAHNWFACVDHPSDKATIGFKIQVPEHYEVVSNGLLLNDQAKGRDHTYEYRSSVPLPTKVMVVGIADFLYNEAGKLGDIKITSVAYPENSDKTWYDMQLAPEILKYFIDYIGPYEYEKLDNVQSTTRYGGMENAGCIFYDENAFNGKRTSEGLIAHEIAHQWFGNSASEMDWPHIWLSEGFATYFTNLYIESKYGEAAFDQQMLKDRSKVFAFEKTYHHAVVDTNYRNLNDVLNPNSYQKGSWVLHMLRRELGDSLFHLAIQNYYAKFRLSNAETMDLMIEMERVSDKDLDQFFKQWLYSAGHPEVKVKYTQKGKKVTVVAEQKQKSQIFIFDLTIRFELNDGTSVDYELPLKNRKQEVDLDLKGKIKSIKVDPEVDMLVEWIK
jgi:aminopeptidase N